MTKRPAYHQPEADHPDPLLDLCCWSCGYSLRGLTPEGACPECGSAILESVVRTQSPFADLPKVMLGAKLLILSTATGMLLLLVLVLCSWNSRSLDYWFFGCSAPLILAYVIGAWLTTAPRRNQPLHLDRFCVPRRRIQRRVLISGSLIVAGCLAIPIAPAWFNGPLSALALLIAWMTAHFLVIGESGRLRYVQGLFIKLKAERGAELAGQLALGVPVAGLMILWSPALFALGMVVIDAPICVAAVLAFVALYAYVFWMAMHFALMTVIRDELNQT